MSKSSIPAGIDIDALAGHSRRVRPNGYRIDDVSWNADNSIFLLAYTVDEVSMGNYVGNICFGKLEGEQVDIIWNPEDIYIFYGLTNWCHWLDENTVIFKTQKYDPVRVAAYGGHMHIPLLSVN